MLLKIILVFLGVLIIPDLFIYYNYIARLQGKLVLKLLYFLPTLLLLAGIGWNMHLMSTEVESQQMIDIQRFIWILLLISIPKLAFFIATLLGLPFQKWMHVSGYLVTGLGLFAALACFLVILHGGTFGRSDYEIKEITVRSEKLPESFAGFRMVQISDLHLGSWLGREKEVNRIIEAINALQPDVILFTGDLVNSRADEADRFLETLASLHAPHGVYTIMGNHDYGTYYHWPSKTDEINNLRTFLNYQEIIGWKMLNNAHVFLHQSGDSIALIGCENWGEPPFSQYGDLQKALKGAEETPFKVLMTHNPCHWRAEVVPHSDIQLTLCGHTHAMQLQAGHHSPSSLVYPEWGGMYQEGDQSLYVNIGLGITLLPIRVGTRPEITVITLEQ